MPEQFKPYSSEEAWDEAELMKQKMAEKEGLSYARAEEKIELEKIIEGAKDGTLASKIKTLDLSTDEGVEELRKIFIPWNRNIDEQKILNTDGEEIFQTETPIGNYESKIAYILRTFPDGYFEKLGSSNLEERSDSYGHEIYKSAQAYLELSSFDGDVPQGLESNKESDKFINTIGAMARFIATSMNGGLPGDLIIIWGRKIKAGELTEDFVNTHPNHTSIMEMAKKSDTFFETLFKVFLKYLSCQIQNHNFNVSGDSLFVNTELIKGDFIEANEIKRNSYTRNFSDIEKEACSVNISQAIMEETNMFVQKIEQYQKVLDEFNERLEYAKPQTKN